MKKKKTEDLDKIIKRINTIEKERPGQKEILRFVKYVIREQHKIKPLIKMKPFEMSPETARMQMKEGFPLIDKKDMKPNMDLAATLFKNICGAIRRNNKKAAPEITKITQAIRKKVIDLQELFKSLLEGDKVHLNTIGKKAGVNEWLLTFLAESSINPFLEAYAQKLKAYIDDKSWFRGYCPVCGSAPVIGEFRNEGERYLVCSSCGFLWRFDRLSCPFCGTQKTEKHRHFYIEKEGQGYRVEVCDECKKYIKTIDTRALGEITPLVEDMGSLHLDILAQKEGYKPGVTSVLDTEKAGTA